MNALAAIGRDDLRQNVTATELQRAERQLRVAGELGLTHVYAPEIHQQTSLEDALVDQFVMQHQADALGIYPTNDEADEAAQKLTAFRGPSGNFDPNVKDDFVAQKLSPRGFTEGQVIELVKRDLQFAKLRELLDSTIVVTPLEVRTTYEQYFTKAEASVIRFKTRISSCRAGRRTTSKRPSTRKKTNTSSPNVARCNTCASAWTTRRRSSPARSASTRSLHCATRRWPSLRSSTTPRARRISLAWRKWPMCR